MEVSIIVYFVKCDQIKLEAEWILCIRMLVFFFQKWCPGFKSPSLKWAHHKTNTLWQQAGSLCSYEAQNLMSMNNEYYSTCWWLSRLPVIRSMKALFSRERSLSRWMMDSHHPRTGNNFFSDAANQQMATDTSQTTLQPNPARVVYHDFTVLMVCVVDWCCLNSGFSLHFKHVTSWIKLPANKLYRCLHFTLLHSNSTGNFPALLFK